MKRYRPKRNDERRSFSKDLWPADIWFEDAIAGLRTALKNRHPTARRSCTERNAWRHLIEACLKRAGDTLR
jgi:hypothetical protein